MGVYDAGAMLDRPLSSCLLVALVVAGAGRPAGADRVDRQIRAAMRRDGAPGVALAVVRRGRIARLSSYGLADVEWNARVTPHTRFEIASMSKMFTGAAARILVDQGKLDLEAPVARYLAGIPAAWKRMKVRHLVEMTCGLGEDWGSDLIPYGADVTTSFDDASMLEAFAGMKLLSPIGTRFHYSSPAYAMLGMIVAKLSGVPLATFVQQHLFAKAAMTESSYIDNWALVPQRARGYRQGGGKLLKGWYLGQYLHARPDVGVLSSARDMAAWVIALERGRIVADPQVLWQAPRAPRGPWLDYSYGWIMDVMLGHRRQRHDGQYRTGFRSTIARYPDDDLTVIVLANCDCADVSTYAFTAARAYLADLPDLAAGARRDPDPALTSAAVTALEGLARHRIDEAVMTADAIEPLSLDEVADALPPGLHYTFAAGRRLAGRPVTMHGHRLVAYVALKATGASGPSHVLSLYKDEHGKIVYIAPL